MAPEFRSRLVLGTAQLVSPYGIARTRPSDAKTVIENAHDLLQEASRLQLTAIDTAPGYGASERVIGTSQWSGAVWTKLDPNLSPIESIRRSLRSLRRTWIDVVFFHDLGQLHRLSKREMADLKGLVGRCLGEISISAYEVHEVLEALDVVDLRIVQIPINVFDTRFEESVRSGELPSDLTYVARSALLQGALSSPAQAANNVPARLARELESWSVHCSLLDVSPGEASLSWVLSRPFVDCVIVGAECPQQLSELVAWSNSERVAHLSGRIRSVNLWPLSDPRTWR